MTLTVQTPICGRDGPSPEDAAALLHRYRPLLAYDPQEEHRALPVESLMDHPGNALVRDGDVLAEAGGTGNSKLCLELLGRMAADGEARDQDQIRAVAAAAVIRRTQDPDRYPAVAYGRVKVDEDRIWLQYWLWFYFRLGNLFGWRQHQGGWELFQIGLSARSLTPEVVSAGQKKAVSAEWDSVARWVCAEGCPGPCAHPVANVDLFTHAIRFDAASESISTPGPSTMPERSLPEVREFGGWNDWPGRWGETNSRFGFGRSPCGPAHQSRGWESPERFHREASVWSPAMRGRGAPLGRPGKPAIREVRLNDDTVVVDVAPPRSRLHRVRWIFVTVHEGEHARVIRKRLARARKNGATLVRIPLLQRPPADAKLSVCVRCFDHMRNSSEVAQSGLCLRILPDADAATPGLFNTRVWKRFHHGLLRHLHVNGALTAAELEQNPPRILDLPLVATEVRDLLESARRHGLVEPLDIRPRAGAQGKPEPEWTPSERGRAMIGGAGERGLGLAKLLPLAAIVPVAREFTADPHGSLAWGLAIAGLAVTLLLLVLGTFFLHHVSQGALPRRVASAWDRHAVELPALNRWYRRPVRLALYLFAGCLVTALVVGATISSSTRAGGTAVELAGLILFYGTFFLIAGDLTRVALLRNEAQTTRGPG